MVSAKKGFQWVASVAMDWHVDEQKQILKSLPRRAGRTNRKYLQGIAWNKRGMEHGAQYAMSGDNYLCIIHHNDGYCKM